MAQDSSEQLLQEIYSVIGGATPTDKGRALYLVGRWFEDFHQLKNSVLEIENAVVGTEKLPGLKDRVRSLEEDKTIRTRFIAGLIVACTTLGAVVGEIVDWFRSFKWGA